MNTETKQDNEMRTKEDPTIFFVSMIISNKYRQSYSSYSDHQKANVATRGGHGPD